MSDLPHDLPHVDKLISEMAQALAVYLAQRYIDNPAMVGIHSGGAWVAARLHRILQIEQPLGTLDISFYRDDFTAKGLNPQVQPSELPFAVEAQHIVLVDDVLMTGRTIRAALNELFDYGRPASVTLVTLIDICRRELPIQADIVGKSLDLPPRQRIKLRGPDTLYLELVSITANAQ
jgi:pyrimidine operon attenuation protein / uracil phosphoribosyltransferase